jgi:hypothetical protein
MLAYCQSASPIAIDHDNQKIRVTQTPMMIPGENRPFPAPDRSSAYHADGRGIVVRSFDIRFLPRGFRSTCAEAPQRDERSTKAQHHDDPRRTFYYANKWFEAQEMPDVAD